MCQRMEHMEENGLKQAPKGQQHLFGRPKCSSINFGKTHFSKPFGHIFGPKRPFVLNFWKVKMAQKQLEGGHNHLFGHPKSSRITFGKTLF